MTTLPQPPGAAHRPRRTRAKGDNFRMIRRIATPVFPTHGPCGCGRAPRPLMDCHRFALSPLTVYIIRKTRRKGAFGDRDTDGAGSRGASTAKTGLRASSLKTRVDPFICKELPAGDGYSYKQHQLNIERCSGE
ncbi:hypothetical protein EVAR_10532_1 [Eumeta japonica]|uniref:Uncharacterized protein n=1 Tax=Eumeta variegata TaxID=151549 RepID=A0A4C1TIG3_EUMVA|nr:hypothetical protein EVAR_10532_1 [Eumeta japonica]